VSGLQNAQNRLAARSSGPKRVQGSSSVVKVTQQFVLSLTPECANTHLRASAFSKIFRGLYPRTPSTEKGGEKRGGEGKGRDGQGKDGKGRG
jgi:hypothetical protein